MAVKNRTEVLGQVTAVFVPTLNLTQHKGFLNEDLINSAVLRKDVIAAETPGGGVVTIDYSDKDTATATTAADLAVSFSNIENGDVKFLEITKQAGNVISFAGASDMVNFRDYINTTLTVVTYRISNKNGVILVEGLFAPSSTQWQTLTLEANWTGSAKYRINNFTGKIEIFLSVIYGVGAGTTIAILPANARPAYFASFPVSLGGILNHIPSVTKLVIWDTALGNIVIDSADMVAGGISDTINAQFDYYQISP